MAVGFQRFGDTYYYLKHQVLVGLLPGVLLFIFSRFDYHKLKNLHFGFYYLFNFIGAYFCTGFGLNLGGARRWLALGPLYFNLELIKLTLVIYLAAWFERRVKM